MESASPEEKLSDLLRSDLTTKVQDIGEEPTAYLKWEGGILMQQWTIHERRTYYINGEFSHWMGTMRNEWRTVPVDNT